MRFCSIVGGRGGWIGERMVRASSASGEGSSSMGVGRVGCLALVGGWVCGCGCWIGLTGVVPGVRITPLLLVGVDGISAAVKSQLLLGSEPYEVSRSLVSRVSGCFILVGESFLETLTDLRGDSASSL